MDEVEISWQQWAGNTSGSTGKRRALAVIPQLAVGEHEIRVSVGGYIDCGEDNQSHSTHSRREDESQSRREETRAVGPQSRCWRHEHSHTSVISVMKPSPLDHQCQKTCSNCPLLQESDSFALCLADSARAHFSGHGGIGGGKGVNEDDSAWPIFAKRLGQLDQAFRRGGWREEDEICRQEGVCALENGPTEASVVDQGDGLLIMDIGANLGADTRKLIQAYPRATIYSYEPVKEIAESLNQSLASEGLLASAQGGHGIHVRPVALGATSGVEDFAVLPGLEGLQAGSGLRVSAEQTSVEVSIPARGIADEIAAILEERSVAELAGSGHKRDNATLVLHVNCEGCEYGIITGLATAKLLGRVQAITMGTHLLPQFEMCDERECLYDETVVPFRYCLMHRLLQQTHDLSWGMPWTWERWVKKRNRERSRRTEGAGSFVGSEECGEGGCGARGRDQDRNCLVECGRCA